MLINCTNHPSDKWHTDQQKAAEPYGQIQDRPFPEISPRANTEEIQTMAKQHAQEIARKIANEDNSAVLCQGEFTYTYALTQALREKDITVLAACSERRVQETQKTDGISVKESIFQFVQFRPYP